MPFSSEYLEIFAATIAAKVQKDIGTRFDQLYNRINNIEDHVNIGFHDIAKKMVSFDLSIEELKSQSKYDSSGGSLRSLSRISSHSLGNSNTPSSLKDALDFDHVDDASGFRIVAVTDPKTLKNCPAVDCTLKQLSDYIDSQVQNYWPDIIRCYKKIVVNLEDSDDDEEGGQAGEQQKHEGHQLLRLWFDHILIITSVIIKLNLFEQGVSSVL